MSHHSVESMRDIAFRKGRHAFKNDADCLAAMTGDLDGLFDSPETDDERLERLGKLLADHTLDSLELLEEWLKDVSETEKQDDLPPDFELVMMINPLALPIMARPLRFRAVDAAHVTVTATDCCRVELGTFRTTDLKDLIDDIFQTVVDNDLNDEKEEEDKDEYEVEATGCQSDFEFESFLDSLLTDGSANAINRLFDWVVEYDSGNKNVGISVTHGDAVLHLQPDVDCETLCDDLKFKLTRKDEEDMAGGYDFIDLVNYLGQIVDDEESPFVPICNMVDNELGMADCHGDLGGVWRGRIAGYLTYKPMKTDTELGLALRSMDGEVEDARLEFRRRPHLPDGDTTWVFDGEPSKEHKGKGCPTVLLQWLLRNHKNLL